MGKEGPCNWANRGPDWAMMGPEWAKRIPEWVKGAPAQGSEGRLAKWAQRDSANGLLRALANGL